MLKMMDGIKEGDGTLLDHSLVLATSESNYAKIHSVEFAADHGRGQGRRVSGSRASTSPARAIPARASA